MSFIASILDALIPTRTGVCSCACGEVKIELSAPGSSYGLIEQTSALCHCKDCVGFTKKCGKNGENLLFNNAVQMVQFYDSDVKVVAGKEHIGSCRLREKSTAFRCYCKLCGTPLGIDVPMAPLTILYTSRIQKYTIFLPNLVLNFASALPGTQDYGRNVVVKQDLFSFPFFAKVIARALLGLLFGKGRVGGLLEGNKDDVSIGLDSITFGNS